MDGDLKEGLFNGGKGLRVERNGKSKKIEGEGNIEEGKGEKKEKEEGKGEILINGLNVEIEMEKKGMREENIGKKELGRRVEIENEELEELIIIEEKMKGDI